MAKIRGQYQDVKSELDEANTKTKEIQFLRERCRRLELDAVEWNEYRDKMFATHEIQVKTMTTHHEF
jgi:hypothetical protein